MYYYAQNKPVGIFFMALGFIMLIAVAGELLVRLALAAIALWILSYGMRLYGMPVIQTVTRMWMYRNR